MVESWVFIEGANVEEEKLRSISLSNAQKLVIGKIESVSSMPGGWMLHIAANSPTDLGNALPMLAEVPGVTGALTLLLKKV